MRVCIEAKSINGGLVVTITPNFLLVIGENRREQLAKVINLICPLKMLIITIIITILD